MNCIFCKIINEEISSYTIYEDEYVKVFLDIYPDTNGHTLIIPKKHYQDITDIPLDTLKHINQITKNIYRILETKLKFDGLVIIQNNGSVQEIKHYHLHLKPIYNNQPDLINVKDIYQTLTK